ncbi:hypothetical protein ACFFU9_08400 [Mariniflexile ostreae]|uniref:T9SS C-terminal target domain-containing protein n=1 Tax=Mariniflexile ostreae TaxID=1520892 RepID=A0ABV5FBE5_9FLAO
MKKITCLFTLLICALGHAQTTLGYYTERAVTATVVPQNLNTDAMGINTEFSDSGTDGGSYVIEAKANTVGTNYQAYFNYPGSPDQDLSAYDAPCFFKINQRTSNRN